MDPIQQSVNAEKQKNENRQLESHIQQERNRNSVSDPVGNPPIESSLRRQNSVAPVRKDPENQVSPPAMTNISALKRSRTQVLDDSRVVAPVNAAPAEAAFDITKDRLDITTIDLEKKTQLLQEVNADRRMYDYKELKVLLDLLLGEVKTDNFLQDREKQVKTLQMAISSHIATRESDIFLENVKSLTSSFLPENSGPQLSEEETEEGNKLLTSFNEDLKIYENLADDDAMYSPYDKLVRKLEFYRTYEKTIASKCEGYQSIKTGVKYLIFQKQLANVEAQFREMENKVKNSENEVRRLEGVIQTKKNANPPEDTSAEENALLKEQKQLDEISSTTHKKNVLAIDNSVEKSRVRRADETLDERQIKAVREIDQWMLSKAEDTYKDKIFMLQVMGMTIRQRMAMYVAIELGVDKMDYGTLLYSQANYLPQLDAIQSNMYGKSILRRIGGKRIHWSKMRRAYEYVSGQTEQLDDMANVALSEQEKKKSDFKQSDIHQTDEDVVALSKRDHDPSIGAIEDPKFFQLSAVRKGTEVLQYLQQLRSMDETDANRAKVVDNLKDAIKLTRSYIDQALYLAEGTTLEKGWKKYKATMEAVNYNLLQFGIYKSVSETVSRSLLGMQNEGGISNVFDYGSAAALVYEPMMNVSKAILDIGGMVTSWGERSATADVKSILGIGRSVANATALFQDTGSKLKEDKLDLFRPSHFAEKRIKDKEKLGKKAPFDKREFKTVAQVIGSAVTLSSAAIDYYNYNRSRVARSDIQKKIQTMSRGNTEIVSEKYRTNKHKQALVNLSSRIGARQLITTTSSIVFDGAGYLKYLIAAPVLGMSLSIATFAAKMALKGIDYWLKKRSDQKTVDEFLDMKQLMDDYKKKKHLTEISEDMKTSMRKRAMLQLGFANTATFFQHVAKKLGELIHTTISRAKADRKNTEAEPYIQLLRSMGFDATLNRIPPANKIAGKLSA